MGTEEDEIQDDTLEEKLQDGTLEKDNIMIDEELKAQDSENCECTNPNFEDDFFQISRFYELVNGRFKTGHNLYNTKMEGFAKGTQF